jgi:GNAT superfamily N-acetyltransferase
MTWAWILAVADQLDDSPDARTFLERHPELFRGLPDGWAQAVRAPDARRCLVAPGPPAPTLRRVDGVLPEALHAPLTALVALVFEGRLDAPFARSTRPRASTWIAEVDGQIVGFKLGYEERSDTWHSTLGAVDPAFRGLGIGRALMRAQHEWARELRYRMVTTSTRNRFRAMLQLNLSEGFDVVGVRVTPDGEPKILLEKRLTEPGWGGFQGPP